METDSNRPFDVTPHNLVEASNRNACLLRDQNFIGVKIENHRGRILSRFQFVIFERCIRMEERKGGIELHESCWCCFRGLIQFSSTVSNVVPRPRHRGNPWLSQEKGALGGRAGLPFVFRAALSIICK